MYSFSVVENIQYVIIPDSPQAYESGLILVESVESVVWESIYLGCSKGKSKCTFDITS